MHSMVGWMHAMSQSLVDWMIWYVYGMVKMKFSQAMQYYVAKTTTTYTNI